MKAYSEKNALKVKRVYLVQPPFVQINGPYPSLYYLKPFLEKQGCKVTVWDHSIGLFERIFSRRGLEQIFEDSRRVTEARKNVYPKNTFYIIERFFSEEKLWLDSIDRLIAFLRGRDREWGHFLTLANGCLPGGPRCDAFIAEQGGEIKSDSAGLLASKMLADLADFITVTLDSGFSLIRYTPSIGTSFRDFKEVEMGLGAYIMAAFYRPFLEEEWDKLRTENAEPILLGIGIPFPGCLSSALVCAESAKKRFGKAVITVAGGGFVNTELRFTKEPAFFKYFDHLSLDRPYAFLLSLILTDFNLADLDITDLDLIKRSVKEAQDFKAINDEAARTVFPDYSEVDFSKYLYPVDDANAMHRLWSDGHWLKVYLAHGCYWHSCSFCDVSLDYIRNFIPVDPETLFSHLREQAEKTGCRGIHFVDEAAPPASLVKFSLLNREAGLPLTFWGNIRMGKDFSPDTAAILASGGLVGVSAGLEVITDEGLRRIGKGAALRDLVRSCAAFKEAGILVHGYLIYGYWDQDEEEIINSAEIVRQFFSHGLLDSAFWHKFILTRHSRLFAEKAHGLHPGLEIRRFPDDSFALNDLSFKGEEGFDKYSDPLEKLLSAWMAGYGLEPGSTAAAFPFKVPAPTVAPDLVQAFLDEYAGDKLREQERIPEPGADETSRLVFLGSRSMPYSKGKNLWWRWRLEDQILKTQSYAEAKRIADLLEKTSHGAIRTLDFFRELEQIQGTSEAASTWRMLRKSGLTLFK